MKKNPVMIKNIFRNRIFTYYFLVFITFTIFIVLFQYYREREYRRDRLKAILENVSLTADNYIREKGMDRATGYDSLDALMEILPVPDLRLTLIDKEGNVLYDSDVGDYRSMANHIRRPEVRDAIKDKTGFSVRQSSSTGKKYFYYAFNFDDYFIRAAAEYTFEIRSSLKIDKLFLLFIIVMFLVVLIALIYINERMGLAIRQLKNFAASAVEEKELKDIEFPKNELGNTGMQILEIYNELKRTRDELLTEQQKIFRHLQTMEEGVAVFSPSRELLISNNSFVQNANLLSGSTLKSPSDILNLKEIRPLMDYLGKKSTELKLDIGGEVPYREIVCHKKNKYFLVRANVFKDNSFEIIIKDITKSEKNRVLKQELTSNIAHELRTPVTSIMGYLETLLNTEIDPGQARLFLSRTRDQAMRLAELIDHISVLNKLEEGKGFYEIENISVYDVVSGVVDSMKMRLESKNMTVDIDLDKNLRISGNKILMHSIYQNLIENTINYAGVNVTIYTGLYFEDSNYYYFRYSNDGKSIPDRHIPRLFERFYRIDEGRSRKKGGTGLGLAIVKHAVQFHRGQISVKNLEGGGIEFLFSISKNLQGFD